MSSRARRFPAIFATALTATVVLAYLAVFTSVPVHRSSILITDPDDPETPQDFDAILLRGVIEGSTLVVTLTVAGFVQDSGYNVGILVQDWRHPGETAVYRLDYQFGAEENYETPTERTGQSLTFRFPLTHLWPGAYVVGLDANVFGPVGMDSFDNVREGPREGLRVERLLVLPIDTDLLLLGVAVMALGTVVLGIKAFLPGQSILRGAP